MDEIIDNNNNKKLAMSHERALNLIKSPKINTFTSDYIVGLLSRDSLLKI